MNWLFGKRMSEMWWPHMITCTSILHKRCRTFLCRIFSVYRKNMNLLINLSGMTTSVLFPCVVVAICCDLRVIFLFRKFTPAACSGPVIYTHRRVKGRCALWRNFVYFNLTTVFNLWVYEVTCMMIKWGVFLKLYISQDLARLTRFKTKPTVNVFLC